ncbi:MAG: hypothetical protein JXP34_15225 [Planctomycetes bacterium]|nr:hypothetical protein [Planctomycetota bacterium]
MTRAPLDRRRALAAAGAVVLLAAGSARAGETAKDLEKALADRLDGSGRSLDWVLDAYGRIEARESFAAAERLSIHDALVRKIREVGCRDARDEVERALRSSRRSDRAARILLLKALARGDGGLDEDGRAACFQAALGNSDDETVRWAMKALSIAKWPRGIDLVIERMRGEEKRRRADSEIWIEGKACLYRVFGTGMQFFTADEFQRHFQEIGRKIPDKRPDYLPAQAGQRTAVFFGELVIGRGPVFTIDLSSSMRQEVTEYRVPAGKTWAPSDVTQRKRKKFEWVKEELIQAVKNLVPPIRFNIVAYNGEITIWRGEGGRPVLVPASESYRAEAIRFVQEIETQVGTHTQQALEAAFAVADCDTIYLLSDGVPSGKSAPPPRIIEIVAAANYLRGARIIALGFKPEGQGSFDEAFLEKLADENWGWYRRLNRDPRAKKD